MPVVLNNRGEISQEDGQTVTIFTSTFPVFGGITVTNTGSGSLLVSTNIGTSMTVESGRSKTMSISVGSAFTSITVQASGGFGQGFYLLYFLTL